MELEHDLRVKKEDHDDHEEDHAADDFSSEPMSKKLRAASDCGEEESGDRLEKGSSDADVKEELDMN
jgi:hypothetical protein